MWYAKTLTVDVYFFPIYVHQKKDFLASKKTYPQKKNDFHKANMFEIFFKSFFPLFLYLYIYFFN